MESYPKPGETGGRLIRLVKATFKEFELETPLTSYILCGVSAGSDSLALAHLLARYGRRVCDRSKIVLFHVNHHWRGDESNLDQKFVEEFASSHDLPFRVFSIENGEDSMGESLEDSARKDRAQVVETLLEEFGRSAWVLSAHHADDVFETFLWRLFSGGASTHAGAIRFQNDRILRPFLRARKTLLRQFLKEEGLTWREDSSNLDQRFLRARIRSFAPAIEESFPNAVNHVLNLALKAQKQPVPGGEWEQIAGVFRAKTGQSLRRAHLQEMEKRRHSEPNMGPIELPGGWRLQRSDISPRDRIEAKDSRT